MVARRTRTRTRTFYALTQDSEARRQRFAEERQYRFDVADLFEQKGLYPEAEKFCMCHEDGRFVAFNVCAENPQAHYWPILYGCRLAICPTCSRFKANELVRTYAAPLLAAARAYRPGYSLKHLVLTTPLTLDHPDFGQQFSVYRTKIDTALELVFRSDLAGQLTAKDRQKGRLTWKDYNLGYLAAEHYGEEGGHLHFHLLLYSPFIDRDQLGEQWAACTGTATIRPHIRQIKPADDDIFRAIAYIGRVNPVPVPMSYALYTHLTDSHRRTWSKGIFYRHGFPKHQADCRCGICLSEVVRTVVSPQDFTAPFQRPA